MIRKIITTRDNFSEDLDFSLLVKNNDFSLDQYRDSIIDEFRLYGREVEIIRKTKSVKTNIESAFLKDNTEIYNIVFQTEKAIKIKIEVDKNPPLFFETEQKLIILPFSFMVRCFCSADLFAGKMHAFLFREWRTRVKGRDWFDIEWYIRNNHTVNLEHLKERCVQSGHVKRNDFSKEYIIELLREKIKKTNMERVKDDVLPFVKNTGELNIWTTEYFLQLIDKIRMI